MSQNKTSRPPTSSPTDEAIKEVYDELINSLCIEVAYGVHRMARTGVMKLSDIMVPRGTGNGDGPSPSTAKAGTSDEGRPTKGTDVKGMVDDDNGEGPPTKRQRCTVLVSERTVEPIPSAPMVTRNASSSSSVDIWGRVLPMEPKKTVKCFKCGKCPRALNFAAHLDKCLVGNTRTSK